MSIAMAEPPGDTVMVVLLSGTIHAPFDRREAVSVLVPMITLVVDRPEEPPLPGPTGVMVLALEPLPITKPPKGASDGAALTSCDAIVAAGPPCDTVTVVPPSANTMALSVEDRIE